MAVVIDGTTGITSPADSLSGNLTFTGTGNRITGDFSNATIANRVMFQTSTANSSTVVQAIPNGTGNNGAFLGFNNSDPTNASFIGVQIPGSEARFASGITGTGTYLPMTFYTGGSERIRIDTSGNVGIGTSSPSTYSNTGSSLVVNNSSTLGTSVDNSFVYVRSANRNAVITLDGAATNTAALQAYVAGSPIGAIQFWGASSANPNVITINGKGSNSEVMRIDSSGNLLFNSGFGSVSTAYGCRAWVNFNGTGTVAIRASGNVSSITDNGVGDYTLNFTSAMPDANYSYTGGAGDNTNSSLIVVSNGSVYSTTALRIHTTYVNTSGNYDTANVSVAIFR